MANVYVSGAVAITTDDLSNCQMQAENFNSNNYDNELQPCQIVTF